MRTARSILLWILMLLTGFPLLGLGLFLLLSWKLALPIYAVGAIASVLLHRVAMNSLRLPVLTGIQAMTGRVGTVASWEKDRGTVRFRAELWRARSEAGHAFVPGAHVRIVAVENLELAVVREPSPAGAEPGTGAATGSD